MTPNRLLKLLRLRPGSSSSWWSPVLSLGTHHDEDSMTKKRPTMTKKPADHDEKTAEPGRNLDENRSMLHHDACLNLSVIK
jgi:hypothetical protein